jgi:hypothetical protein
MASRYRVVMSGVVPCHLSAKSKSYFSLLCCYNLTVRPQHFGGLGPATQVLTRLLTSGPLFRSPTSSSCMPRTAKFCCVSLYMHAASWTRSLIFSLLSCRTILLPFKNDLHWCTLL